MSGKTAVLIVNLGTPDDPTPEAVKRYLSEFLHDKRVIKLTRWLWCPLLHGVILPTRSKRVARLYEHIWTPEGSPMRVITQAQADALAKHLGPSYVVKYAMRYGNPSMESTLASFPRDEISEWVLLPLYPQHSDTTTRSVIDAYESASKKLKLPAFRVIPAYHQHPLYIKALSQSIQAYWDAHGRGEKLLLSFHGIPQKYVDQGDIYTVHCQQTVRSLVDALQLKEGEYALAYQSRFGPTAWVKPYADGVLEAWAKEGIKTVDVVSPAFAADCLETLEEIALGYQALFKQAGGQALRYIPALNTLDTHIDCLAALIKGE